MVLQYVLVHPFIIIYAQLLFPSSTDFPYEKCVCLCSLFQMFDVLEGAQGSIPFTHSFEPAHQDGLEALSILGDSVYSAARDHCIRRWDLSSKQLKQVQDRETEATFKT